MGFHPFPSDVTAVCLLEGFQNQEFMIMADRILKEVGKELAAKYIKVTPLVTLSIILDLTRYVNSNFTCSKT